MAKPVIATPTPGQRLSGIEFEGILRRQQLEAERLAEVAKPENVVRTTSTTSTPSSATKPAAPAEKSGSTEGVAGGVGAGTSEIISPEGPVREAPGSPTIDDRPAGDAAVRPAQPAPRDPGPQGPAWRCAFCWRVVPGALQAGHGRDCRGSLAMGEAFRWRAL